MSLVHFVTRLQALSGYQNGMTKQSFYNLARKARLCTKCNNFSQ